jgi:UDP-N-acetylmuramate dehydrogenase
MISEALVETLHDVAGLEIREDEPAARHCLLRVGGPIELWLVAETEAAVEAATGLCKEAGHRVRPVATEHFLVRDGGVDGIWLKLGAVGQGIVEMEHLLDVGADHPVAALAARAGSLELAGYQHLATRSGTVGEAFVAGFLDQRVDNLRVMRGSKATDLPPEKILDAHMLLRVRLKRFALGEAPAEPVVRRPAYPGVVMVDPPKESAENLVYDAGLSGVRLHGVRISRKEPNSLVNLGGSSARDVTLLLHMIRDRVRLQTGEELNATLKPLGREN